MAQPDDVMTDDDVIRSTDDAICMPDNSGENTDITPIVFIAYCFMTY